MTLVPVCDICGERMPRRVVPGHYAVLIEEDQFEDACERCIEGLRRMLESLKAKATRSAVPPEWKA